MGGSGYWTQIDKCMEIGDTANIMPVVERNLKLDC